MIVFKRFVILQDPQNSLENTIDFLLNCEEYSWDKIYLFSAFITNHGVEQVKKILEHRSLNEKTEVRIAIGTKNYFNNPSDIQKILSLSKPQKINTPFVSFICPKSINDESHINDNFHIKAYCFLGSMKGKGSKIGFSIIGSSNLTKAGLEGKGELCISIQNLNLTKELIDRLSNKYRESPLWNQEIIKEYEGQYHKEHSRKDQNEVLPPSEENSTPVNQDQAPITSTPPNGKFLKLGVLTDSVLIAQATNLANDKNIGCFHSIQTIDEEKNDVRQGSLCLLLIENKIFQIAEIRSHCSYQEKTEGCFVTYKENVTYELSEHIREILSDENYKKISDPKNMDELPYKTLKDFGEEVKEYQEYQKMLDDPKYQKWIEKGKEKMRSKIDRISEIDDISLIKKELELLRQSL